MGTAQIFQICIRMLTKINPFEHHYFLGYISQVSPQFARIHFPTSVLLNGFTHYGQDFCGGLVGNFLVIEGDKFGFLGRLSELSLPESERLSLNEKAFQTSDFHPTGKIEILLSFDLYDPFKVKRGLTAYPNIGAKVFVCSEELVQRYLSAFGVKEGEDPLVLELGHLVSNPSTVVSASTQSIFGRHCAVVGTTGGGKSYTVSKLIEGIVKNRNKAILIDATGEYNGFYQNSETVNIGDGQNILHYTNLAVDDFFFLLRPSPRVQVPKLMDAIRSLKIASIIKRLGPGDPEKTPQVTETGLIVKAGKQKLPFDRFFYQHTAEIENGLATFDIQLLAKQIMHECVYDDGTKWGNQLQNDVSFCTSLVSRVNNLINTADYDNIFGFKKAPSEDDLTSKINKFLLDDTKSLLRINFENVKFEYQIREILANAIAKVLLNKARGRTFRENPLILLVDEAHQFLNKKISDEYFDVKPLDAFDLIAKECRKYGLFLCIATQMPRDIPHGTLSQMGTFIVHRLINQYDKEAIYNACSSANRNSLDFLPVLGEGEALLTGVDFPMPIIMRFYLPQHLPNSQTPKFKKLAEAEDGIAGIFKPPPKVRQ